MLPLNFFIECILPVIPFDHPYDIFKMRLLCKTVKRVIDYGSDGWWDKLGANMMPGFENPKGVLQTCKHMHTTATVYNEIMDSNVFSIHVYDQGSKHDIMEFFKPNILYDRPLIYQGRVTFWDRVVLIFNNRPDWPNHPYIYVWVKTGNVNISPDGGVVKYATDFGGVRTWKCSPDCKLGCDPHIY